MARVTPPTPYTSWNVYTDAQLVGVTDPDERRLIKRNIKLELIASVERYAGGDTTSPSYREYNIYETPGTFSPTPVHPWRSTATDTLSQILLESGEYLGTEDNFELSTEGPDTTPYDPLMTTLPVQNVAGADSATGFFFLGSWGENPQAGLQYVQAGWTVVGQPTWIVTATDESLQTITISGGVFITGTSYAFTVL